QPGEPGGMVHAALPRLDDRRRLDRNPQEPHRRAPFRPPVRSARAQARRSGGVILTVALPELTNSNLRDALFSPRSVAIVGQSSLGVVDLRTRVMLTANAAFDEKDFPLGRIFAASHSGSMIGALMSRGKARGTGFAGFVSVGNEVDLSLGEICAATLDDPDIDGYMLFLETMRHADTLRRFAHAAAERGKPIIAYKLGRSATARELAVSHTGAL